MIIVVDQKAQISNRLVALAALIAHCMRHDIEIIILSLEPYRDLFERHAQTTGLRIVFLPPLLYRLTVRLFQSRLTRPLIRRLGFLHRLDNKHQCWTEIQPSLLRSRLWFIEGSGDWCPTMPAIGAQEAPPIRHVLSFRAQWHDQADRISSELRRDMQALVGVHARRGDYVSHRGGRWFYGESDYLRWIEQVPRVLPNVDPQRIRFVVCTNEAGFLANTGHDALVSSPMGSAPGDQLLLSRCDLILGPPSTFSVWAAFLSDTQLLHLFSRDQELDPSQLRRSTVFYDWRPRQDG